MLGDQFKNRSEGLRGSKKRNKFWDESSVAFAKWIDLSGGKGVAGVSPFKGPRLLVIGFDKIHESLDEFLSGFEDSAADDLAR